MENELRTAHKAIASHPLQDELNIIPSSLRDVLISRSFPIPASFIYFFKSPFRTDRINF